MNQEKENEVWYSWPVIILALCFFWPIGIFLLIKRADVDSKVGMIGGKIIYGIGIVLCAVGGFGFLVCLATDDVASGIIGGAFWGGIGYYLVVLGKKMMKQGEDYQKYYSLVVNERLKAIDQIASIVGKNYSDVKSDLQKMINKGMIKNAYINESLRLIVLTETHHTGYAEPKSVNTNSTRVVTCECCGANNTISFNHAECEYCGSPLKR